MLTLLTFDFNIKFDVISGYVTVRSKNENRFDDLLRREQRGSHWKDFTGYSVQLPSSDKNILTTKHYHHKGFVLKQEENDNSNKSTTPKEHIVAVAPINVDTIKPDIISDIGSDMSNLAIFTWNVVDYKLRPTIKPLSRNLKKCQRCQNLRKLNFINKNQQKIR